MVKELLTKKLLILFLLFACLAGKAQKEVDSVVMTVAGKEVFLSEFLYIARKNEEVKLSDNRSLREYVVLFKNFKLKVAEAESLGIDTTRAFVEELEGYRCQLGDSYQCEPMNLSIKYPEFNHLMREYHDGMLLFEISNREVWSKPVAEQSRLEIEWIERLEAKYPVIINWKLLKKIKK